MIPHAMVMLMLNWSLSRIFWVAAVMFALVAWLWWCVGSLEGFWVRLGFRVGWVEGGLGSFLSPVVMCSRVGVGGWLLRAMAYLATVVVGWGRSGMI